MKSKLYFSFLILVVFQTQLSAQCAMCKAVVETNLKQGGSVGAGLNEGILYLMAIPYIVILFFSVVYYLQKSRRQIS